MKAMSWRVIGVLITMVALYIATNSFSVSLLVGGIDALIKTVVYYFHERLWNKIKWGTLRV